MQVALDRKDVPLEERWNAESVFATPSDWQTSFKQIQQDLNLVTDFQGTLGQSSDQLLRWLSYSNNILREFGKLRVYATLDFSTNSLDKDAPSRFDHVRSLAANISQALASANPQLINIGFARLQQKTQDNTKQSIHKH